MNIERKYSTRVGEENMDEIIDNFGKSKGMPSISSNWLKTINVHPF